jgi:hypothetical protein
MVPQDSSLWIHCSKHNSGPQIRQPEWEQASQMARETQARRHARLGYRSRIAMACQWDIPHRWHAASVRLPASWVTRVDGWCMRRSMECGDHPAIRRARTWVRIAQSSCQGPRLVTTRCIISGPGYERVRRSRGHRRACRWTPRRRAAPRRRCACQHSHGTPSPSFHREVGVARYHPGRI